MVIRRSLKLLREKNLHVMMVRITCTLIMGLFEFKEVGGSEKVGSKFFFFMKNENLCVSFLVFGW